MKQELPAGQGLTSEEMNAIQNDIIFDRPVSITGPDVEAFVLEVTPQLLKIAKDDGTVGFAKNL